MSRFVFTIGLNSPTNGLSKVVEPKSPVKLIFLIELDGVLINKDSCALPNTCPASVNTTLTLSVILISSSYLTPLK